MKMKVLRLPRGLPPVAARRRRRGSGLIEIIISVMLVSIVLLALLSAATMARMSADYKESENARQVALRVMEWAETVPLSADFGNAYRNMFGDYFNNDNKAQFEDVELTVVREPNSIAEANIGSNNPKAVITVSVCKISKNKRLLSQDMTREVSLYGSSNVGEIDSSQD